MHVLFYHSVAINIEMDLLEALDLNQIANVFPAEDNARETALC